MLRVLQSGYSLPESFICDPSAEFQPGMCGQLTIRNNTVMLTVSNGLAPIGIIDDIKTKAFTSVSWDEIIIVPVNGIPGPGGSIISPYDIKAELKYPNVIQSSFTSTVDVVLNSVNGVITFIAGTPLNFDLTGGGTPNAIRTVVNYTYYVANIPGEDSTLGSGRATVWFQRFIGQTSMFESNQRYPLNANLFVSENGLLTTRRPSEKHPSVALVTAPPSALHSMLEFLYL